MGLRTRLRERTARKADESRTKAYEKARASGATEQDAVAAGERAARRRRRARRSMYMS
ncbi:hypothetical protein ABZY90_00100 [Streptomyces sp. NPDC006422]|uniref:hypothetical protein n=1 Tax=unclassified Streptomyces TaxID=2593676 RepID=UPI00339EF9DD